MKSSNKLLSLVLALSIIFTLVVPALAYEAENTNDVENAATQSISAAKTKAIVIIPGILGSSLETTSGAEVWLHFTNYGKMALTETGTAVYSTQSANYDNYGANNTYKTLYNSLNSAYGSTFDVIFFDYDWRMTNTTAAAKLAIELSDYTEVVLVAHSMGGLVASKFLSNSSTNRAKTTALITLGTPFVGSAKCISVMETGEMIEAPLGIDAYLFKNTVRDMSKNCFAAYQLLPTSKYYSITGAYPLSVSGTNYSNPTTQLQNTAWGKKSDGTVKPMFNTATTFHSSLFSGTTHVTNFSDVASYQLGATGQDTISKVSLNSSYAITALTYSNAGDETVLLKSAGYGTPDYSYTGTTHTGMVSNSTVISRVKTIITSETGVSASSSASMSTGSAEEMLAAADNVVEIDSNSVLLNERGWMMSQDNRRINIYADSESSILIDGVAALEENNCVYDSAGDKIGSVWELGETGTKLYAMYDGEYTIAGTEMARIEYMDSGYFEKIVEYSESSAALAAPTSLSVAVEGHETQFVHCERIASSARSAVEIPPTHEYTVAELSELNAD